MLNYIVIFFYLHIIILSIEWLILTHKHKIMKEKLKVRKVAKIYFL